MTSPLRLQSSLAGGWIFERREGNGSGKDGKAVETGQTANYAMPCWKNLVNNTSITVVATMCLARIHPITFGGFGNSTGYPGFIYDSVGRFVYVQLDEEVLTHGVNAPR